MSALDVRTPETGAAPSVAETLRRTTVRVAVVTASLGAATVVLLAVALMLGQYPLSLGDIFRILGGGGTAQESYVFFQVRVPRAFLGALVGLALGASGAILQALLRNPLASPDLLGISGGSSLVAVILLTLVGVTGPLLAGGAFLGGLAIAGILLLVGGRAGVGYRLILAGIGLSFACTSAISYVLIRARLEQAQTATLWLAGSISTTPWWQVATVAIVLAATLPAVVWVARSLPVVRLGDATATGLGVHHARVRQVGVVVAVVLVSVTCAFVGPIGFIALCAPAIARGLEGRGGAAIASSALAGAVLLMAADLVAQFALPTPIPAGLVTGILGAGFLLWLLATSKGRVRL